MTDGNKPRDGRGPEGTLKMPSEPPPPGAPPPPSAPASPGEPRAVQVPDSWDARHSGQSVRVELPPVHPSQPPADDSPSKVMIVLGILTVIAVTAAAGFVAWEFTNPTASPAAPTTAPASARPAASPPPPATTSVATSSAAPSATPSAAPAASPGTCFVELLPRGAFGATPPDLSACCREQPAYPTMLKLKSAVVAAGGGNTTAAMRQWSKLGWYELAAFAVMRAQCCPEAPALTAPSETKACPLEPALAGLGKALDDGKAMEKALADYKKAVECLSDKGHAALFGRSGPPQGGELAHLEELLGRVRRARAR